MTSMTKQQLACYAGVSVRTLTNWIQPYHEELHQLGMRPNMKTLPPSVVSWICEKFCIDVD